MCLTGAFDHEYKWAVSRLNKQELVRLRSCDKPPTNASVYCRKVFAELEL